MSNLFEAAQKARQGVAESILPLIPPAAAEAKTSPAEPAAFRREEAMPARIRRLPVRIAAPSPIFPFDTRCWQASEQYRILRAKLGQHPKQPRVMVVTSPGAKDGKTVSTVNLAGALSLKDQARVLLLEGDMRRPTFDAKLGLPRSPGLADVLAGACAMEEALVQVEELPNLYVMTAGTPEPNPSELLEKAEWPALCARFRSLFRYTIVDSPPMAAVADFDLIQAACDGVILVVRPDQTNRELCRKALETMAKNKFLGIVMNCVPERPLARTASYEYYYRTETKVTERG